jgi:hypothetical protein
LLFGFLILGGAAVHRCDPCSTFTIAVAIFPSRTEIEIVNFFQRIDPESSRMNRPTVLILSSDPAFSREIVAHWPGNDRAQRSSQPSCDPEFTVLEEGFSYDLKGSSYDLAIADASSARKNQSAGKNSRRPLATESESPGLRQSLAAAGRPAILIHADSSRDFCSLQGQLIELRREPGIWLDVAALVGREILRRRQAESRAAEAQKLCSAAQNEATLGRYMVEMRTNVNNALTTVLGNAELLVHQPGLPATVAAQADAIRNMALRLHEVFQRFSSLEKELAVATREPFKQAATAG